MKNNSKQKKVAKISTGLIVTIVTSLGAFVGGTAIHRSNELKGVDKGYLEKTMFNVPVFLPSDNGKIALNIDPLFSEEQKQEIVKGVNQLDTLLTGVDYTISFNEGQDKKAINIRAFDENEKSKENGIALTIAKVNQWTAKIMYPVVISVDTELVERKNYDINLIIKHELLHAMGLEDLNKVKDAGNIMYGYYSNYNVELNDQQLKALDYFYGVDNNNSISVQLPSKVQYLDGFRNESVNEEGETMIN